MKNLKWIAAALLVSALFSGCGETPTSPAAPAQKNAAQTETVPAEKEATLTLYLPDEDGMHVTRRDFKVTAKEKTLKNAVYQLIRLDRDSAYPILPTGLSVKNVTVEKGVATLNFSKQLADLTGGSTTENLFIAMMVNTATEFPNVTEVRFTMEGRPLESLSGHHDMTQAFKRDESLIRMEKK